MKTITYAERKAVIEPLAIELERIAYRLRQGAITEEGAAIKLRIIAAKIEEIR